MTKHYVLMDLDSSPEKVQRIELDMGQIFSLPTSKGRSSTDRSLRKDVESPLSISSAPVSFWLINNSMWGSEGTDPRIHNLESKLILLSIWIQFISTQQIFILKKK